MSLSAMTCRWCHKSIIPMQVPGSNAAIASVFVVSLLLFVVLASSGAALIGVLVAVVGVVFAIRLGEGKLGGGYICPECKVFLFRAAPGVGRTGLTPWYLDANKTVHIGTFASEEIATRECDEALRHGWRIQSVTTSDGHVNLGRTVAGAALTGGLSLFLGGSRTAGAITITFLKGPADFAAVPAGGPAQEQELAVSVAPMFCNSCGAANPGGSRFCSSCGRPVVAASTV